MLVRGLWRRLGVLLGARAAERALGIHRELNALVHEAEASTELDAAAAGVRTEVTRAGLVPCGTCGQLAAPRGGRMSVHFPNLQSTRPCPASWPATTRSKT